MGLRKLRPKYVSDPGYLALDQARGIFPFYIARIPKVAITEVILNPMQRTSGHRRQQNTGPMQHAMPTQSVDNRLMRSPGLPLPEALPL